MRACIAIIGALVLAYAPSHSRKSPMARTCNGRKSLRLYIQRLRQKIGDDPLNSQYIFTEPGIGYRLQEGE